MYCIDIDGKKAGPGEPVFFIAEAGINHQGEIRIAKKLIEVAALSGADAVKFQKRTTAKILTKAGLEAPYENPNSFGKTYGEHRDALEFNEEQFAELKQYAEGKGLIFLASAWDEDSADLLKRLGIVAYEMASADLTNLPLLRHVAKFNKPVILSTGMSEKKEVEAAVTEVRKINTQVALLQCTSTYPSAFEEINLRVIPEFIRDFDCPVGYSGHEKGICIGPAAVALGACIIERHFTLDRTMKGGDHAASLEPGGLQKLIRDIRQTEAALGAPKKKLLDSEVPVRKKLAKSLVSLQDIAKGETLTAEMLTTKSPGYGINPSHLSEAIGKTVAKDIKEDHIIEWADLE